MLSSRKRVGRATTVGWFVTRLGFRTFQPVRSKSEGGVPQGQVILAARKKFSVRNSEEKRRREVARYRWPLRFVLLLARLGIENDSIQVRGCGSQGLLLRFSLPASQGYC